MHNAYVASDLLPAMAFWLVALLAAGPAFAIMRQGRRGRARSAIAYLAGFFLGLAVTVGLSFAARMAYGGGLPPLQCRGRRGVLGSLYRPCACKAAPRRAAADKVGPGLTGHAGATPPRQSIPRARRLL